MFTSQPLLLKFYCIIIYAIIKMNEFWSISVINSSYISQLTQIIIKYLWIIWTFIFKTVISLKRSNCACFFFCVIVNQTIFWWNIFSLRVSFIFVWIDKSLLKRFLAWWRSFSKTKKNSCLVRIFGNGSG